MGRHLSGAGGIRPPKSIVNACAVAGFAPASDCSSISVMTSGAKIINSGALTADELKSVWNVIGSGAIQFLAAYVANAIPRTLRARLTIDDIVVFDYTSAEIVNSGFGLSLVGSWSSSQTGMLSEGNLPFYSSADLSIASSLTEADAIRAAIKYWTT